MPKALFLVLHRKDRSPGQRYRHEQYLTYLEENGFQCDLSPLLSQKGDEIFYSKGSIIKKIVVGVNALLKRLKDLRRAHKYNVIYVYRDAFFFGTYFEKAFSRKKAKLIFDYDDAIWLMDKNENQGIFNLLKKPKKTSKIISLADEVIVGNNYLATYAKQFNDNVQQIPSTIDFSKYGIVKKPQKKVCIGWTGSFSTIKHFEIAIPALKIIKEKYGSDIYFKIIGDPSYENKELKIEGVTWKSETEAEDLSELDVGLMPLPDNEWSRGKCAMKGLQYMALGIPTIMSPIGINADIINDGKNGFLASTMEEWVEKLSLLVEKEELRRTLGTEGRKTVENDYSVEANKDKWLKVFQD